MALQTAHHEYYFNIRWDCRITSFEIAGIFSRFLDFDELSVMELNELDSIFFE